MKPRAWDAVRRFSGKSEGKQNRSVTHEGGGVDEKGFRSGKKVSGKITLTNSSMLGIDLSDLLFPFISLKAENGRQLPFCILHKANSTGC
jgi:hypothetical protein